ncbi:iron uptake transporter permease EfeU [Stenotrophomonas sp.]|uniref:iron uptake transporter permease EfeU n=1 Tax=Stenotrophomonas sp. TaxID=69392 RepID=UPI002D290441|nr:iron uptake transporter permease EfeU [Stenotrophomonas sp.]HYQ22735.1 iron uptake transporter permease EfeU [Stenotrophomonas sp.]
MLVPFLIMLREGIEAALIVGIIAGYLRQSGRQGLMPFIWVGVFLAIALSLFAGAALQLMAAEFPQKQQELFEGVVGLIAVAMLTSMVFWMRGAAQSIKGNLQNSVDRALLHQGGPAWALIGVVFLAVAREGLESVFFLLAIFQQSHSWQAPVGALLGTLVAVAIGYGLYLGGVRLDLRRFFRLTGLFILLVAAGLLAGVLRKFHEAGLWNHLQQVVVDLSGTLPLDSPLGALLSGLFGYQEAPVVGEVIVYVGFLLVTVLLFLRPAAAPPARPVASA